MRYINDKGELNDPKIVVALQKAARWYENGEIQETLDLLLDVVTAIQTWVKMEEKR